MRSRFRLTFFLLPLLLATAMMGQSPSLVFYAALTDGSGTSQGFGSATLTINGDQAILDVTTLGLPNITSVSLYQAGAGASGPLVQTFADPSFNIVNGRLHRTLPFDPAVALAIAADPQNYQLVVTAANPNAVLRGQLTGANTTYLAGTISGTSPICSGGGIPNGAGSYVFAVTPDPGGLTYTVRYDLMTRGLGGTISALQIGGAKSGPGLFTLGGNVTSSDGRFTGTSQITAGHARLLQTLPESTRFTVTTPATGIECAAAGPIRFAREIFIPVAGTVRGIGNTNYMTDVNILNNTSPGTSADVLVQYFPTAGSTATAAATSWSTLTPRATATYRDISTTAFPGLSGIGALRVISADSVFANARIYNNLTATGGGTFGQFVPGLPRGFALTEGTLLGLTSASGSGTVTGAGNARTNIGFFNPSETATTMILELRNASGTLLAQRQLTLMPWMQLQMPLAGSNGLFTSVSGDVGTSSVYFLSGAPLFVYASVIDNPTGDANYVAPSTSSAGGSGAGL